MHSIIEVLKEEEWKAYLNNYIDSKIHIEIAIFVRNYQKTWYSFSLIDNAVNKHPAEI